MDTMDAVLSNQMADYFEKFQGKNMATMSEEEILESTQDFLDNFYPGLDSLPTDLIAGIEVFIFF